MEISQEDLDDAVKSLSAAFELKLIRLQHPYVLDLIRVLSRSPQMSRPIALDYMHRYRKGEGLPIPRTFDSSVQASLQYYCEDSDEFQKRGAPPSEALFRWPRGKGQGVWALNRENAKAWLHHFRSTLPNRIDRA